MLKVDSMDEVTEILENFLQDQQSLVVNVELPGFVEEAEPGEPGEPGKEPMVMPPLGLTVVVFRGDLRLARCLAQICTEVIEASGG